MCRSMRLGEERKKEKKKEEGKKLQGKNIMAPLLHRAAIKTVSGKVVAQSIAFRVVSIYSQGVAPFP